MWLPPCALPWLGPLKALSPVGAIGRFSPGSDPICSCTLTTGVRGQFGGLRARRGKRSDPICSCTLTTGVRSQFGGLRARRGKRSDPIRSCTLTTGVRGQFGGPPPRRVFVHAANPGAGSRRPRDTGRPHPPSGVWLSPPHAACTDRRTRRSRSGRRSHHTLGTPDPCAP
jgi:hypothetical protein